ncbi:MAG: aminomethyl transferase family protein [Gemmatimonadetes bacterium]|nr:aminomethyl transferase family protein [Gemmatimonadota bacterium]
MAQTPRTTPFHARVAPLNQTGVWKHWSGYLVAPQYHFSLSYEYYAIRNAAALLDTSPLFKYRFSGPGAGAILRRILARDIGACRPGRAQYTCWCDARGFILQDGVILHVRPGEYWLTAAEPSLRYFRNVARDMGTEADIVDISGDYGILALQGPHSHDVIAQLTDDATPLRFFDVCETSIDGCDVVVSRTGYTGDLGYEIWIRSEDAETVWDALAAVGGDYNLTPMGTTPLKMARMEAGLLLMGVDFQMSRFAWVDEERDTPLELGWSWMFRKLDDDDRDFVGRVAIEREVERKTSRWKTVGLALDWDEYENAYSEVGLLPPRHEIYRETTMSVYRRGEIEWDYAGYATSFTTSSLLRKPLALAKLPLDLAEPGSEVDLELSVLHRPTTVLARVEPLPFFDPPRKTASMGTV